MMSTDRLLSVDLYHEPVGVLTVRGNLTTFEFSEAYLEQPGRPVLSQYFEEEPRGRWRQSQRVPAWFANLLPEDGPLLDFLSRELGVSSRSEIKLLEALGVDLPGAVTVRPTDRDALTGGHRFDQADRSVELQPDREGGVRFSVAGVQLKLSMVRGDNTIRLAGRGEWGNSFVKFSGSIARIPENEFAMMTLASRCGLDVPEIDLVDAESLGKLPAWMESRRSGRVYVIQRFDRDGAGQIHIEDINQVIGNWPEAKYEGMSYETLGRLILNMCGEDDFWEYFERVAFTIAVGNEDAHLKNWSLIYRDRVNPRLSPLYDVVSTVVLPDFTRESALKLRRSKRPQSFDSNAMSRVAEKCGLSSDEALGRLEAFYERLKAEEPAIRAHDWLDREQWSALDDYRRSVPMLRHLVS